MKECYFCKSSNVETIFFIEDCPIAGNFLTKVEDDYLLPLDILICKDCGMAQLNKELFIPKEKLFMKYFYNTHSIITLKNFFYEQAEEISAASNKKLNVLEIGGNSCPLGERLVELGHSCINVDPSDTALDTKPDKVELYNGFFDLTTAKHIKEEHGAMDVIYTANNFAHMEDLMSVIEGIKLLLSDDGKLIIQVQDFEYLLEELCFPFLYHEHLFYYTSYTLEHMLARYGFRLVSSSKNKIHGRSINCIFEKTEDRLITDPRIERLDKLLDFFTSKIDIAGENIKNFLIKAKADGKKVIAYGASGQANILFAKFGIKSDSIPYVVDDAPLKLGKFTPYSHIEIKHSSFIKEYKPDYIFVTAYNFINEIKSRTPDYEGTWLVPLPDLKEV